MNTRAALHNASPTRSTKKAETRVVVRRAAAAVGRRLASLKAADLPWLSKEGLAAFADAPEVCGSPTYKKPRRRG